MKRRAASWLELVASPGSPLPLSPPRRVKTLFFVVSTHSRLQEHCILNEEVVKPVKPSAGV